MSAIEREDANRTLSPASRRSALADKFISAALAGKFISAALAGKFMPAALADKFHLGGFSRQIHLGGSAIETASPNRGTPFLLALFWHCRAVFHSEVASMP
ncbi:MAG: hypothetical protein K5989_11570 [Lachnospiraceae bacterium]|nr:hypothetical protein [Lachnospiraceae bacterium]